MTWQWTLSPRIAGKALHGRNDDLWKSARTDTLSYTVAHSSFWMKNGKEHKQVVKSGTSTKSRDGGTGRRSGLKIRRPSGLGGSTPPPGTKPKSPQNERLAVAGFPHQTSLKQTQRISRHLQQRMQSISH